MVEAKTRQITTWTKILIEFGILIMAVGIAWATLSNDVEENADDIAKHDDRIKCVEKITSEVNADIREIKVHQKYITEGIKEIKDKLK